MTVEASDNLEPHGRQAAPIVDFVLGYSALAKLVRAEYPNRTLAEIAETWGPEEDLTADEIAALRRLDGR